MRWPIRTLAREAAQEWPSGLGSWDSGLAGGLERSSEAPAEPTRRGRSSIRLAAIVVQSA